MALNPGTAFDPDWIRQTSLDDSRAAARALQSAGTTTPAAPTVDEAAALRLAVRCLDLTDLGDDATDARIDTLCAEARGAGVAAVCVFPPSVATAVAALRGYSVPVAAACGFPDARDPLRKRSGEIRRAVASGAREIDAVVDTTLILGGEWAALYDQVCSLREASAGVILKIILRSGILPTSSHILRAGLTCAMAGADFLKTSTGMDPVNATASAGIALADSIRAYRERTGYRVGLKPAGGLRTAPDALAWMRLTRTELGAEWIDPGLFRLGASSLLGALRSRLAALAGQ